MKKEYKNVDEQIKYLRDKKKINVDDSFKCFFEERSYISLINPYKEIFSYGKDEKGNHIYKAQTNIEDLVAIAKIDDMFSIQLFQYIGIFEIKYKNILFDEICLKYIVNGEDRCCIKYVEEIENYFIDKTIPRFCSNLNCQLSKKGYVKANNIDKKEEVLNKIMNIGRNMLENVSDDGQKNILIKHYLDSQKIVPLWVVSNALTLGELNIVYSMLDKESQINIIKRMNVYEKERDIQTKDILSFSGMLEKMRIFRNTINHYEPIFPIFARIKDTKHMEDSIEYKTIELLRKTFFNSSFNKNKIKNKIEIVKTNYNERLLKVLQIMVDEL